MLLSPRVLGLALLWSALLLGLMGLALVGYQTLYQARATARRRALAPDRIRNRLEIDPEEPAALDRAAEAAGKLGRLAGLPHLILSGGPYQRGFAHGRLLRVQVRSQIKTLLARVAGPVAQEAGRRLAGELGFSPRGPVAGLLAELTDLAPLRASMRDMVLDDVAASLAAHTPPAFRDEMRGLADGAGLDSQLVERFHALAEVASAGCSNLAAWGPATRGGEFIQYRNLDWSLHLGVQDHPLLIEQLSDGERLGHLTAGFAGFLGALQGLNEAGITLGEVGAGSHRISYDGQPMVFRLRRVLEEAADLDQVDRIMKEPNRTKGYGFLIGHLPARQARGYEMNADRTAVFHPNDQREASDPHAFAFPDVLIRGDYAVDPEIRRQQHAADGPGDPRNAYSYRVRYQAVGEAVRAGYGDLDVEAVLAMARASGDASQNLVSILYLEDGLRLSYARGAVKASAREYVSIPYAATRTLADLGREGSPGTGP